MVSVWTKLIPRSDPKVKKIHFAINLLSGYDKRFRRQVYFHLQMHKMVLIHYLGDESIAEHFPHGNSQHNKIYYRTYPSVISKVATAHDFPGNVYKKAISTSSCSGQHHPHAMPRNSQQVLNAQHKERPTISSYS